MKYGMSLRTLLEGWLEGRGYAHADHGGVDPGVAGQVRADRRELVRVYLTNVEGICRRFLEEKRETLAKLRDDADKWEAMREFLTSDLGKTQAALATEKADALLKAIVKRFFNEKEVTSTLVMDALYCGCRALDVGAAPGALDHAAKNVKPGRSILLSIAQNKVRE